MIDWETFKSQLQTDPGRMLKSVLLLAGCLFMIWLIVVMQSNPGMQQNVQVQESGRLDSLRIAKMQSTPGESVSVAQKQYEDTRSAAKVSGEGSKGATGMLSTYGSVVAEKQPGDSVRVAGRKSADSLGVAATKSQDSPAIFRHARPERESTAMASNRGNGFTSVFPTVLILLVLIGGVWYWLRTLKKSGSNSVAGKLFTTIASQQLPGGPKLTVVKLNGEYWVMASGGPQGTQLMHRYSPEEWNGLEEVNKQQEKRDWKNTFLKTLNTSAFTNLSTSSSESASGSSSQQKKTG